MRRMDGVSAYMLAEEQPGAYMHTLKIAFLDVTRIPGGWSYERFRESCVRRLHLLPFCRWKFLRVPFGLHHPVWVDDADFDLDYHMRRVRCPAPGDRAALCALISQVYSQRMDPSKPLWMTWIVEGLDDGTVAMVSLLHHAYTDGSGAARLLERLFTGHPTDIEPSAPAWSAEPTPSRLRLLCGALIDLPLTWVRNLPKLLRGARAVRRLQRDFAAQGKELPPKPLRDSRDSPFNILVGHGRTFVFETLPLAEIRALAKGFGVTMNDLFMAAAAGAYRRFMQDRGFDPDRGPLVASIPFSRRPPAEQDDCIGNMTSADYLSLPVHLAEPRARLEAARHAGNVMKEHFKAAAGADISSLLELSPPLLLALIRRITMRRRIGLFGNAVLSNVPGPQQALWLGHLKLANWVSMGQIMHGMGLNTTVWSYDGKFNLCVLADSRLLPDGWVLIDYYREAFAEYAALLAAGQPSTTTGANR